MYIYIYMIIMIIVIMKMIIIVILIVITMYNAYTSAQLPPPFWPEQEAPERAGDPAKRVARKKSRLRLTFSPQQANTKHTLNKHTISDNNQDQINN